MNIGADAARAARNCSVSMAAGDWRFERICVRGMPENSREMSGAAIDASMPAFVCRSVGTGFAFTTSVRDVR